MVKVGRVVWVDYTEHNSLGPAARVGLRMEDGSKRNCYFTDIHPWGYVHKDAEIPDRDWIEDIEYGYESLFDDPLKRVTTTIPQKVNSRNDNDTLVDHVEESFEADLPMYRKLSVIDGISGYLSLPEEHNAKKGDVFVYSYDDVDTDIDFTDEIIPRVMISDIEVSIGDETFKETRENASQPINVICSYDTYEKDLSVFFYDKYDSIENASEIREIVKREWKEDSEYPGLDIELRTSPTEEEMLNDFINYTIERDFDLTSGWNWINFDYEYIINRMKALGEFCGTCGEEGFYDSDAGEYYCPVHETQIDVDSRRLSPFSSTKYSRNDQMQVRGLPAFDMMRAFCDKMTLTKWRSQSLDYVANEELGVGKIDEVDINEDWEHHPEKLIGYNIVDVLLTVALDDANDIHKFFYDMGDGSSIPIYDTYHEKRLVDGFVMSRRGDEEILPSASEAELIENAGGYVDNPVDGRYNKIGVSDLKSLYPSAMITWNISTETVSTTPDDFDEYVKIPKVPEPKNVRGNIREDDIKWDWLYASLDEQGLIPRTLQELFKKREYEKSMRNKYDPDTTAYNQWDRKQAATKVVMNSFYGNASSKYWRLSDEYLGDAVTSTARYTLWKGRKSAEDYGYSVIYGDTDSHFIELGKDRVEKQVEELTVVSQRMDDDASEIAQDIGVDGKHPFLKDHNLHGDEYTCMVWEPEKVYHTWMQLGKKKRYAGNIAWEEGDYYDDGKISISGFENRRSDSMEATAELQERVIELILKDADFSDVSEYINAIIDRIDEDNSNIKEFALPGSINKDLEDYPNRQVPRACMWSNEHLDREFSEGDDPFVYLIKETPSGLPQSDVLALEWNEEIPDGFKLDKEAIIERGIRKPIDLIIQELGWTFDEIRSGRQTQTMDLSGSAENPFA